MVIERTLRSGKKVKVKTLTALEEVLTYMLMGKNFSEDSLVSSALLQRHVSAVLSLAEIDGEAVTTPQKLDDAFAVLGRFSKPEFQEVLRAYDEANDDEDPQETLGK